VARVLVIAVASSVPILNYAVMPVARTLSPATRESHQPDAA